MAGVSREGPAADGQRGVTRRPAVIRVHAIGNPGKGIGIPQLFTLPVYEFMAGIKSEQDRIK